VVPPNQFAAEIIRPVLEHLEKTDRRLNSIEAEKILLGTAIAESRLSDLRQKGGPALSMFQIEPSTFEDIFLRYLPDQRPDLLAAIEKLVFPAFTPLVQLPGNQHLACAIARIRYWMDPAPLPKDINGLANYWKRVYNASGRGSPQHWAMLYRYYSPE
jgi:hypothetical protein